MVCVVGTQHAQRLRGMWAGVNEGQGIRCPAGGVCAGDKGVCESTVWSNLGDKIAEQESQKNHTRE